MENTEDLNEHGIVNYSHNLLSSEASAKDFEEQDDVEGTPEVKFILYRYRFFELALYCLAAMLNQICWVSLQPVAGAVENAYGVGNTLIVTIGLIYMGIFIIVNFPSNFVLDKFGLRPGVLLGLILTCIGMWIKCLINKSFGWVLFGQIVAAIGQPLLLIAPAKLAAFWFGENERVIAVVVGTAFQPLGAAVGYVFPSFFVTEDDSDPQYVDQAKHDIYLSLLWQAILGTVITLLCIIFFREKPKTKPSAATAEELKDLWGSIGNVVKDRNFLKLMFTYGIILGVMNAYANTIGVIAVQYDYSAAATSLFGAIFIFGGLIGSGIFGGIVEAKKTYKITVIIISVLTAVTPLILLWMLLIHNVWLVSLACLLVGFSCLPILPVGIDFAVELTHPIPESISSGIILSTGQLFGIVFTLGASTLITNQGDAGCIYAQGMLVGAAIVAAIISIFIQENLKRLKEQQAINTKDEKEDNSSQDQDSDE